MNNHVTSSPLPTKGHVVLIGDSIIDNRVYVSPNQSVTEQLIRRYGYEWTFTRLALDGAKLRDIHNQLTQVPQSVTHIVFSGGGNDALNATQELYQEASSVQDALTTLTVLKGQFQADYRRMLDLLETFDCPLAVMSIYDRIPMLPPNLRTALCLYNDTITREVLQRRHHLVDLRTLFHHPVHFSGISEIEPSEQGGEVIVGALESFLYPGTRS